MIGVIGAGSFGTALAIYLGELGHQVVLWARRKEFAQELSRVRENLKYLPGVKLPDSVKVTNSMEELQDAEFSIVAIPSHCFREVIRKFLSTVRSSKIRLVSATKGIEVDSLACMSQVTFEEGVAAGVDVEFAVLSGPSFAYELARKMPTAVVVASENEKFALEVQHELSSQILRIYSSPDVVGVEVGGASKNVIAVAAGIISGLGYGYNTLVALITRGLHEIARLAICCGGKFRTIAGLAGLGDLVLTCMGKYSRNRRVGQMIAEGKSLDELHKTGMVAEGIKNSFAIFKLACLKNVEMPITTEVKKVIYDKKDPRKAITELMTRELKSELEI